MKLLKKIQLKKKNNKLQNYLHLEKGTFIKLLRQKFNKKEKTVIGRIIKIKKTDVNIILTVIYLIKKYKVIETFSIHNKFLKDIQVFSKYKQI